MSARQRLKEIRRELMAPFIGNIRCSCGAWLPQYCADCQKENRLVCHRCGYEWPPRSWWEIARETDTRLPTNPRHPRAEGEGLNTP